MTALGGGWRGATGDWAALALCGSLRGVAGEEVLGVSGRALRGSDWPTRPGIQARSPDTRQHLQKTSPPAFLFLLFINVFFWQAQGGSSKPVLAIASVPDWFLRR